MRPIFGTSIRTTLIGYLGAIAYAMVPVLQGEKITLKTVILAVVVAMLGRFAKDTNQTGVEM